VRLALLGGALAGGALLAFTVATRDPDDRAAVGLAVAGAALAVAGVCALLAVTLEERAAAMAQPRRRYPRRGRALRRGLGLGALVAVLGLLRAVDALSLITATFVLAGFVLGEYVLSSRSPARSG